MKYLLLSILVIFLAGCSYKRICPKWAWVETQEFPNKAGQIRYRPYAGKEALNVLKHFCGPKHKIILIEKSGRELIVGNTSNTNGGSLLIGKNIIHNVQTTNNVITRYYLFVKFRCDALQYGRTK